MSARDDHMESAWHFANWPDDDSTGRHVSSPQHGLTLSCAGGPLDGRQLFLTDARFSLWVAARAGDPPIVRGSVDRPTTAELPTGGLLIGAYIFDRAREALVWRDDEHW